ncbi:hypothetical protein D3C81_1713910 [compost metagenome]
MLPKGILDPIPAFYMTFESVYQNGDMGRVAEEGLNDRIAEGGFMNGCIFLKNI